MTTGTKMRCLKRMGLAFAVAAFPALLMAVERSRAGRDGAKPGEQVEMFAGIEKGVIDVQLIPKDSTQCKVLIKNKTDRPLSIKLPDAFAGVPVLAQLGGPAGGLGAGAGGGRGGGTRGSSGLGGGGNQAFGGGMGGMGLGGMGGMGMGGMGGGFFNVAPEKVGQLKVPTVCLEHGKRDPQPHMKYQIKPIEQFTNKPGVREICAMLGRGELDQRVAQVAAWHLNNDMSWDTLIAKQYKFATGMTRPYFSRQEIQAAMRAVSLAVLAAESPKAKSESASLHPASQNAPN